MFVFSKRSGAGAPTPDKGAQRGAYPVVTYASAGGAVGTSSGWSNATLKVVAWPPCTTIVPDCESVLAPSPRSASPLTFYDVEPSFVLPSVENTAERPSSLGVTLTRSGS